MTPYTFLDAPLFLGLGFSCGCLTFLPDGVRRMKRWFFTLLAVCLVTAPLQAQVNYLTLADITVAGTAANVFTSTDILAGNGHPAAQSATCALTGGNIRWTVDGTTPTTNLGTVQVIGNWTWVGTSVLLNLQAIRDDSTSGVLSCTLTRQ